jgi:hypothetical protein
MKVCLIGLNHQRPSRAKRSYTAKLGGTLAPERHAQIFRSQSFSARAGLTELLIHPEP